MNEQHSAELFDEVVDEPGQKKPNGSAAGEANYDAQIASLATLSLIEYDKARAAAAESLGIRVTSLDKLVEQARPKAEGDTGQGTAVTFEKPVPWTEPVDGEQLLADLTATLGRHVVLSEHQRLAVALWIMHTHALGCADHSPRLHISSPVKRCGKTVLLHTVAAMVPRALATENISTAALFRLLEMHRPTMLIDEADTFVRDNEDLRGLLNAGHARNGRVVRVVGDSHEPRSFGVWGAVALAGIGEIPPTIEDRSVTIALRRRRKEEGIERLGRNRDHLTVLAHRIARWIADNSSRFSDDPLLPDELNDRAQDNWRPLIAIADAISSAAGQRARAAALALENEAADAEEAGVMLLADVFGIFEDAPMNDVLSAHYIVEKLVRMEDRPWPEWKRGNPLTKTSLARLLKPFGIRPKQVKAFNAKGYERAPILEAHGRYCSAEPEETIDTEVDDPF
jgi:putative DNA primase/helicase